MASNNRYQALLEEIFFSKYKRGCSELEFVRGELSAAATKLGMELPKNLGDVIYAVRYRIAMPESVLETQPKGMEWVIEGAGRAKYRFRLEKVNRIVPNPNLLAIKIPDATPELVSVHCLSDEQALLALVRYNRLIDLFFGVLAYSLQNHLRTTVRDMGQIEIDEIYAAVDQHGRQFVVPVQAKGGSDQISVVQAKQDMACCGEKYPNLICRAVSVQFLTDRKLAIFELVNIQGQVKVAKEQHFELVSGDEISEEDLAGYVERAP